MSNSWNHVLCKFSRLILFIQQQAFKFPPSCFWFGNFISFKCWKTFYCVAYQALLINHQLKDMLVASKFWQSCCTYLCASFYIDKCFKLLWVTTNEHDCKIICSKIPSQLYNKLLFPLLKRLHHFPFPLAVRERSSFSQCLMTACWILSVLRNLEQQLLVSIGIS